MKYIRITFQNLEPLRIADDSEKQSGQMGTLSYIPGSTMRGIMIRELIHTEPGIPQQEIDDILSDNYCFLNFYVTENGKEMIPSIKGFYEDKSDSNEIQSVVVTGEVNPGWKRAGLGQYCFIDDSKVHYLNVEKSSDMKINLGRRYKSGNDSDKRNVFRNEAVRAGNTFVGYAAASDPERLEKIKGLLENLKKSDSFFVGSSRFNGYGKCRITDISEIDHIPYEKYAAKTEQKNSCYMVLLSNMTMLDEYGENMGIDPKCLEEKLGVDDLQIKYASTSVVDVRGFNRKLGIHVPSVKMYEMGSVFKLTFDGSVSAERIQEIEDRGIGVRRNEGFGRVLIFNGYENIREKEAISNEECTDRIERTKLTEEDEAVLKIAAKGIALRKIDDAAARYLNANRLDRGGLKVSQLGAIRSLAVMYRYEPHIVKRRIDEYLGHAGEKDNNRKRHNGAETRSVLQNSMQKFTNEDADILTVIPELNDVKIAGYSLTDLFDKNEREVMLMNLLKRLMSSDNRKERADG